jgi:hypothetical protein
MGDSLLLDCSRRQQDGLLQRLGFYKLRARVEIAAATDMAVAASLHATEGYPDPRTPDIGWRGFVSPESHEARGYAGARIALGLADSDADLSSGEFFPHEANLDQLGGVSFGKGCYIGQEVVSRMEHRGTARSRILPVTLDGEAPAKGSDIRSGDRQIGTLLSSSGNSALALIRLDRLAEASAPLLTETVRVHVLKPRWARYDVPQAEGIA